MMIVAMMIMILMIQRQNYKNNEQRREGDGLGLLAPTFYTIILKFDLMIMIVTIQRQGQ